MNTVTQHNIGALLAMATSVLPQAAAAAITGAAIDRLAHNLPLSCVVHQVVGAETGAPTGVSVVTTLQHSPDNSTWTAYTQPCAPAAAATAALTAVNTENSVAIDLASAQRYIRAVTTPTFTGGSSPTILVAADIVLSGEPFDQAV